MNDWRQELEFLLDAEEEIGQRIRNIGALAARIGFDNGDVLLDRFPHLFDHRPTLAAEFRDFIVWQEIEESRRLLKSDLAGATRYRDVVSDNAKRAYDHLTDDFASVHVGHCRKAVMVGCGWRPTSAFHILGETETPEIVAIDNVQVAVDAATALAQRLRAERLHIELQDGLTYDYGGAQLIYVASMVSPKSAIVSRIAETAPENALIVLWEPASLGRLWVESGLRPLDSRLKVVGRAPVWWLTQHVFTRKTAASS